MNVRLEIKYDFSAGAYIEDNLYFNQYYIHLDIITISNDFYEQNIAADRISHMIHDCFAHSVFVDEADAEAIEKFKNADIRTISVPGEPVDQILGMMLFSKITAVVEDKLDIFQLKISSKFGGDVVYLQSALEDTGPFDTTGWWSNSEPVTENVSESRKVVQFNKNSLWADLGLDWESAAEDSKNGDLVVLDLDRDDEE